MKVTSCDFCPTDEDLWEVTCWSDGLVDGDSQVFCRKCLVEANYEPNKENPGLTVYPFEKGDTRNLCDIEADTPWGRHEHTNQDNLKKSLISPRD